MKLPPATASSLGLLRTLSSILYEHYRPLSVAPAGAVPNGLDLTKIHPKRGERFSPNLHRWLSYRVDQGEYARVYVDSHGQKFIGYIDGSDFIGQVLARVLTFGAAEEARALCYPRMADQLTEMLGFWEEYVVLGRCAIDTDHSTHFRNSASRFVEAGDTRKCAWCGKVQHRHRWTEMVSREKWV